MKNTHKIFPTLMIMMTVFVIMITVHNVGISMVDAASWDEVESLHVYIGERRETKIKAVSGEDDSETKEPLVLEKVRALLGLGSLKNRTKSSNGESEYGSPASAPSPSTVGGEAPAPAPVPAQAPASGEHSHHRHLPLPRPLLSIAAYLNSSHKGPASSVTRTLGMRKMHSARSSTKPGSNITISTA